MLKELLIPRTCDQCRGTGIWIEPSSSEHSETIHDPCLRCDGSGYQDFYKLVLPAGYFWSCDVLNCIDPAEYSAVESSQRELVRLVLSVTVCDLRVGTTAKTLLWQVFGHGTTSRRELRTLVNER